MNDYWRYRIACALSRALPHGLAYWFGLRIADKLYARKGPDRAAVISNLRQVLSARGIHIPDERIEGLARKTFQYFGKYLVDFFRYARLDREDLDQLVTLEHPEYIEQAMSLKKGVICLSAHLGNWELAGAVMVALGYQVYAVVLPERLRKLDEFFRDQRERRGIKPIPLGNAATGILRCLRRGEFVALVGDRDFTARDDKVTFFGRPARLPSGPARVCKLTGAPIVPAFLIREVDDTFLFRFYPPIYPEEMESEDAIRARICAVLEHVIAEYPHQWFIFDDFWADTDRAEVAKRSTVHKEGDHEGQA